ncbi:MAG TPA: AAA family ATPase, partial [Ignavibacteriaceae bacterium]|nr:AAA family ATPase [Ignavibacteriaceae bacterium]
MEQILYRYNPWWESEFNPKELFLRPLLMRNLESILASKDIIFFTGLRRIGKTSLLKIIIHYLINKKGINSKNIFYVSLDDYLLAKESIVNIIDEFRKIQKLRFSDKIFLFLDEIGYKQNFEIQLKNIYDTQNTKIFAS